MFIEPKFWRPFREFNIEFIQTETCVSQLLSSTGVGFGGKGAGKGFGGGVGTMLGSFTTAWRT